MDLKSFEFEFRFLKEFNSLLNKDILKVVI